MYAQRNQTLFYTAFTTAVDRVFSSATTTDGNKQLWNSDNRVYYIGLTYCNSHHWLCNRLDWLYTHRCSRHCSSRCSHTADCCMDCCPHLRAQLKAFCQDFQCHTAGHSIWEWSWISRLALGCFKKTKKQTKRQQRLIMTVSSATQTAVQKHWCDFFVTMLCEYYGVNV